MAEFDNTTNATAPAPDQVVKGEEEKEEEEMRLKYLEFVQLVAAQTLVCAAAVYAYAKEGAGPLKPGVETVEGTVKTVVGPVYHKFHGVPFELLRFLDKKVGESVQKVEYHVQEVDRRVPPLVKEAPQLARSAAAEVRQSGLVGTATNLARSAVAKAEPHAKELYNKYEPVAERTAADAWRSLHRLPLFPSVARAVVPVAANLTERYNTAVRSSAESGSGVAAYLPIVPTERIARVFADPAPEPATVTEMEPIQ